MALALGLGTSRPTQSPRRSSPTGSLLNHAESPNVSYSVDRARECIVYTSTRAIQPDEELCIFYSYQLWFDPVDCPPRREVDPDKTVDPWGGLANIDDEIASTDMDDIIEETDLPFTWIKLCLEKEEERLEDIELGNCV